MSENNLHSISNEGASNTEVEQAIKICEKNINYGRLEGYLGATLLTGVCLNAIVDPDFYISQPAFLLVSIALGAFYTTKGMIRGHSNLNKLESLIKSE